MDLSLLGQAVAMFVATNVDDLLVLAVFFGRATTRRVVLGVVAGQYLGFVAILVASVAAALGAGLLPDAVLPYFGLVPLALGIREGFETWRERRSPDDDADDEAERDANRIGVLQVAAVTFANGGDNLGVYVPVFAVAGPRATTVWSVVFLVCLALWCAAGWYLATRRVVAAALARWGDIVLPVVLVGLGVVILVEGGAFGL